MHRIDTPNAAAGGLFTNGNPALGTAATEVDAAILNAFQEELANVIEGEGITLDKAQHDQLRLALISMIARLGPLGMRYVTADTAVTPGIYLVDSSAAGFNLTLPAVPNTPSVHVFIDVRGTWEDNPCTLVRNGHTIEGIDEDCLLCVRGIQFAMWFDTAGNTWRFF